MDDRDNNWEIYYKRSSDRGASWGLDTRLTNADRDSWYPSVASSGLFVHVTWIDYRNGLYYYQTFYKRSRTGGVAWLGDVQVSFDTSWASYPCIVTSSPYVHLMWGKYRNIAYPEYLIYHNFSTDNGSSWDLNGYLTSNQYFLGYPCLTASGSYLYLVWEDFWGDNYEIYYKRSTNHGYGWTPDNPISLDTSASLFPSVGASNQNAHVCWQDFRDGNWEIYYRRSTDAGSTWSPETRLTNDPGYSEHPSVIVSGQNVHLVWEDSRDGNWEIYYKCSTDGGVAWSPDVRLTNDENDSWNASISTSGSAIHVVWTDNRDGNAEIYYKRNPTGNTGFLNEDISSEQISPLHDENYRVIPNPFHSFTRVIGHEKEVFTLYDVSGRNVGICRGVRIGDGLPSGVYYLRGLTHGSRPLRLVKMR
jgi:hypothetical protein